MRKDTLKPRKKYCCIKGICARARPGEETICFDAGGFVVDSCSDCAWQGPLRNGEEPSFVGE